MPDIGVQVLRVGVELIHTIAFRLQNRTFINVSHYQQLTKMSFFFLVVIDHSRNPKADTGGFEQCYMEEIETEHIGALPQPIRGDTCTMAAVQANKRWQNCF